MVKDGRLMEIVDEEWRRDKLPMEDIQVQCIPLNLIFLLF